MGELQELSKRVEKLEALALSQARHHMSLMAFLPEEEHSVDMGGAGKRGYSLKEAYEYVGLAKSTFRDRVNRGLIAEPLKDGGRTIYLREDLDAYLDGPKRKSRAI